MPLTTSHAIAAWPVTRIFPTLPLAAVVVGTMSPDFEYLVRLAPAGRSWHEYPYLLLAAIPSAVLVWLLWRLLVRPSLASVCPPGLASRFAATCLTLGELGLAIVGASFGALTHAFWDGFTYSHGWAVTRIPALREQVVFGELGTLPWNRVVQHSSTFMGGVLLFVWAASWWFGQPRERREFAPGQLTRLGALLSLLAIVPTAGAAVNASRAQSGISHLLGNAAVGWMIGVGAVLMLWSLLERLFSPEAA